MKVPDHFFLKKYYSGLCGSERRSKNRNFQVKKDVDPAEVRDLLSDWNGMKVKNKNLCTEVTFSYLTPFNTQRSS